MQMGKFDRPLALIDRALALQPDSRSIRANAALIHYYAGDTATAIDMLEQLRQANPDYLAVPAYLATIYLDQRRYAEFLDSYEVAANVEGSVGRQLIAKAARAALPEGGRAMLGAMLAEQQRQFLAEREKAYKVAATAALLGDNDLALSYLETSVDRAETIGTPGRAGVPHAAPGAALRCAARPPRPADQLERFTVSGLSSPLPRGARGTMRHARCPTPQKAGPSPLTPPVAPPSRR